MKPDRDLKNLLKALAAKGACLRKAAEDGAGWNLFRAPEARPEKRDERRVRLLRSAGLIEADPRGQMVISAAGRQTLRRWLSSGDGFQDQHRIMGREKRPSSAGVEALRVNLAESPLAWLASRKDKNGKGLLEPEQLKAGERLRSDYDFARLMPTFGSGWRLGEQRAPKRFGGSAIDLSDDVIAARQRLEKILGGLEPALANVVVDVCCHLKGLETVEQERGWPARSAKVVLQIGLTSPARHYGYGPLTGPDRSPLRTWVSDG